MKEGRKGREGGKKEERKRGKGHGEDKQEGR